MIRLTVACGIALAAICITTPLHADEGQYTISLLARDSLAGWDQSPDLPQGWQIEDGKLSGSAESTPLLAAWTLGDGELRIDVANTDDATNWRVDLLPADGGGPLWSSTVAEHGKLVLRRQGLRLIVSGDSASSDEHERQLPRNVRLIPMLRLDGKGTLESITWTAAAGDSIFNGQNLDGWWTPGNLAGWKAEDGRLICLNKGGNYLRTEESYSNFVLTLEYKIAERGNSGFGIRTPRDGWPSSDGMELQILDEPANQHRTRHSTMGLYGNLEPLARADKAAGEWNQAVIRAEGRMISGWVNGQLVQQTNTARLPELKHRHLEGWIGFQDHNNPVEFRNIRVEKLPEGLGLAGWYENRPQTGSQLVLDRLMNLETLADGNDGIGLGAATAEKSGQGEQVIADISGRGAVVQISRLQGEDVPLRFYFDGADEPALECRYSELHAHVPRVDEHHREPLLTYLPFEQGLRIVAQVSKAASYRVEYVTLPEGLPAERFAGPEETVARGLLPALSYRAFMGGIGKFRENDPQPQETATPRTIEPGSSSPMIRLEGAGHVQWLRLKVNRKLLTNDDLWLQVTVDGQQRPILAAPARYLLPGLQLSNQGRERYRNFVLLDRDGYRTLLAMPYADGLQITAVNRGKQPLKDVGLQVSYVPTRIGPNGEHRMRLHGQFIEADDNPLIDLHGAGRLIGLVYAMGDAPLPVIETSLVDGHKSHGLMPANLRVFFNLPEKPTDDLRGALSGTLNGLAWRYLLLTPIDFRESLLVELNEATPADRLVLWYAHSE